VLPCWEKGTAATRADLLKANYNFDTQLPVETAAREQGEEGVLNPRLKSMRPRPRRPRTRGGQGE